MQLPLPKAGSMFYVFFAKRVHVVKSKRYKDRAECQCLIGDKIQHLTVYANGTYVNNTNLADSLMVCVWDSSFKRYQLRTQIRFQGRTRGVMTFRVPSFDNLPKTYKERRKVRTFKKGDITQFGANSEIVMSEWPVDAYRQLMGRMYSTITSGRVSAVEPNPDVLPSLDCPYEKLQGNPDAKVMCKVWPDGDTTKEPQFAGIRQSVIDKIAACVKKGK